MTGALLLQHAHLSGGATSDVRIRGGHIEAVAPAGELRRSAEEQVLDLSGYLLLPAPAEPHAHLDKAFTAERFERPAPDLMTAIERWHAHRSDAQRRGRGRARARAAALETLARGATAIRTHVDVGEGIRLRGVEALVAVRDELRELVDMQVVALAYPVAGEAGADNRRMLCEAAEMGVDLVGGAPHVTADPSGDLRVALEVAERYGIGVDLHTDERLDESHGLEELCQRCADGFALPTTASHCVSLGTQPAQTQAEIASRVARVGIGVVTCPLTNLMLQGRGIATLTPRGLTAVAALLERRRDPRSRRRQRTGRVQPDRLRGSAADGAARDGRRPAGRGHGLSARLRGRARRDGTAGGAGLSRAHPRSFSPCGLVRSLTRSRR